MVRLPPHQNKQNHKKDNMFDDILKTLPAQPELQEQMCQVPFVDDRDANKRFLLRWKQDIEDGIEDPLEYSQYLSVCRTFGEDLVNEVDIACAGWEPDEPEYNMTYRERSLSIQDARSTMSTVFKDDPELERAYHDNIAMTIYDYMGWELGIEVPKETRDKAAKAILKLIFD